MDIVVVGTNHKYSPVDVREKVFLNKRSLSGIYSELLKYDAIGEAVVLSTCNRTEIYAAVDDLKKGVDDIHEFFSAHLDIEMDVVMKYFYVHKMGNAVKHLCEVCTGLDSMIVGELQILGQVGEALEAAIRQRSASAFMISVFRDALGLAKKVHSETGLSEGKMSIGSVAVDFIKEKTGRLHGRNILIIGAGKVTALVLKYLGSLDASIVFVANRTFEKAKEIAGQINASAIRFDKLKEYLREADIVITATASPHFIVKKEAIVRREKELYVFDLGMPRDVDPGVAALKGVSLFTMEDLKEIIAGNAAIKRERAFKARYIIDKGTERTWERSINSEPEPALSL